MLAGAQRYGLVRGDLVMWRPRSFRDRTDAGVFAACAPDAFLFLSGFGFTLAHQSRFVLRYESDDRFVSVSLDRGPEVQVSIGRSVNTGGKADDQGFELGDWARIQQPDQIVVKPLMASSAEQLPSIVGRLAVWTQDLVPLALGEGSDGRFDRLQAESDVRIADLMYESAVGRLPDQAEDAWRRKDYAEVVAIYHQILERVPALPVAAARRLSFAERKMSAK